MAINRQTRRAAFGSITGAGLGLGIATLAACSLATSTGAAAANGAMTAIITRVQAGVTALGTFATALGANLTTDAQTAISKVVIAAGLVGNSISSGAAAVAAGVNSTGISGLIERAAAIVIPLLQLVPGLGTMVTVAQDVAALAPTVVAFANAIINPTAASAPDDGGAAQRLGIIA